jgi:sulfur relay protein TusB/DsrH
VNNLYLVSRSTFERTAWRLATRLAEKGDSVIFIQDAVLAVKGPVELSEKIAELESAGVSINFLAEDLESRGLSSPDHKVLDYDGFCQLIENSKRIIS